MEYSSSWQKQRSQEQPPCPHQVKISYSSDIFASIEGRLADDVLLEGVGGDQTFIRQSED